MKVSELSKGSVWRNTSFLYECLWMLLSALRIANQTNVIYLQYALQQVALVSQKHVETWAPASAA